MKKFKILSLLLALSLVTATIAFAAPAEIETDLQDYSETYTFTENFDRSMVKVAEETGDVTEYSEFISA